MRWPAVKTFIHWIILFLLASVPGVVSATEWPAMTRLAVAAPGLEPSTWPVLVEIEGGLAVLGLDESGKRVTFRRGDQLQTLDDEAPAPGGKYFQLHQDGSRLYALWWNRVSAAKWLYLRVSSDGGQTFGPLKVLNTGGAVLGDYQIATNGAGGIAVIFQDERAGYGVFVNRSTDGGKTWLETEIRLDAPAASTAEPQAPAAETSPGAATAPAKAPGDVAAAPGVATAESKPPAWSAVAPKLIHQHGQWLAVWQQLGQTQSNNTVGQWLARTSADGGQTWGPAVAIHRLPPEAGMSEMVMLNHGGQVYLVGVVSKQGLRAFRSPDMGQHWADLGVLPAGPETPGSLRAVSAGDNMLVSYAQRPGQGLKYQVYVATLATGAGAWQAPPRRLDRKDNDRTKAVFAELATLPNGAVIAVWEDYRYILPAVYLDYSSDSGQTWLPAPRPLTEPGRLAAMNPRLSVGTSQVVVLFDQMRDLTLKQRDAAYLTLPYRQDSGLALAEYPSIRLMTKEESLQRIRQRTEELYMLRTQGKFAETWDYYDPVYRAKLGKSLFLQMAGRIAYVSFTLGEPEVDGLFGRIPVTTTYTLPSQIIGGEIPLETGLPQEISFNADWIWFYDDWYFVPPPTIGTSHLVY